MSDAGDAEQVLASSLRLIYDHCPAYIFLLRVEGGDEFRFASVNQTFLTLTGLTAEQVIGKRIEEVIPQAAHERLIKNNLEAIRTRQLVEWEDQAVFRVGKRVAHITVAPVVDASGTCTHLIGSAHDLTRVRRTEELLMHAQKMEALGRLAGGVAHDFNNLLTIILSFSGLLGRDLRAGDPLREGLEEIRSAAERAAGLTRQLLAFSRQQVLQPRIVDLNEVVEGLSGLLQRLIGEDIELHVHGAAMTPRVYVDPVQIEQVVVNLAANARDAMPRGGRLTIETLDVQIDGERARHNPGVAPGSYVRLTVTDTGSGMDAATQDRIFEPFFTTKEKGKGTGLGLAMVLGIVQQSGGHIEVDSAIGRGTTFHIDFPRTERSPQAELPSPPPEPTGTETILLVEDEGPLRAAMRSILEHHGYRVLEACNAGEALLQCERSSGPIALLVTDVVMPFMSGREVADRLHELRPAMRVLYVSGYADDTVGHLGVLSPGDHFLEKPFGPDALARKVREVLDKRA